ncbi:MAG TPA: TetR/AcrR family transcriptional regulator [bacterium]|nr:TetR/AcrR family transcriptional regulator [bacterium]
MTRTSTTRSPAETPTRDRLLGAAMDVFVAKGYHAAAVDDIVAASETSKGAFYHYFSSKQEIFVTLVDALGELVETGVETAIADERGALAKVEAALRVVLETADTQRGLVKILLVEAVGLGPEFEEKRLEIHGRFARLIRRHLDHAVGEGSIPAQDTVLAAQAWLGALNEVITQWLAAGSGRLTDRLPALRAFLLRSVGGEDRARQAPPARGARTRRNTR